MKAIEFVKSKIDYSKIDSPEFKDFLQKELFYLECNEDVAKYIEFIIKDVEAKGTKINNINNSTIAYATGITDQAPTKFISRTPTVLPDFDYDTNARDEIKEYLVKKYGKDHVTLLGTVGTLKTKGAIKDVIRQLRPRKILDESGNVIKEYPPMSFEEVNELTKKFRLKPTDFKVEMDFYQGCIDADLTLKKWIEENPDVDEAVRLLLGNAKTTGIHAGGIVVSSANVIEKVSMTYDNDLQMWKTQPEMAYVEDAGLIKYDFLGLKTLDDLNRVLNLIKERHGVTYTLSNVPMEDKVVLELFVKGKTESVFQFNTNLATSILLKLKEVRSVEDLAMITSIARPGPLEMGMDKVFIERNTGRQPVEYLHPSLEPILKDTYGILCIAAGSKVHTKNGQKNIQDISPGEYVLTEDGSFQKVLANWNKGIQKTVRVRTSNGEELICTPNHKVLTQEGWKEAGSLTSKDLIKSFWTVNEKSQIGTDKDWLIGLSLANGDLCGSQVNISCESESFANRVKEIAEKTYGLGHVKVKFRQRCWKVNLGHSSLGGGKGSSFNDRINPFMQEIKKMGLHGKDCYTKEFPENITLNMIAGFIEGDDSLKNNRVRVQNEKLAYKLYEALQSYRIPSSFFIDNEGVFNVSFNDHNRIIPFKIKQFKNGDTHPHVFIPRSYLPKLSKKEYGHYAQLTYPSKMSAPLMLRTFTDLGFDLEEDQHDHWAKVLSVKEDTVRQVYDLSIENIHSFVVGGLVVHNCYQEDIIKIAQRIGHLDGDSSVDLMKSLSKKKLDKALKHKAKFEKEAVKIMSPEKSEEIFNHMAAFALYGFNKSHAVAYACVSYLCMWFKHHYPAEWISAVLTGADKDDFKILYPKWKDYVTKPEINTSKDKFNINEDNKVVMPFTALNGVGTKAVEQIIKCQPFSSFQDFFQRVDKSKVNKATTLNLIFAGVFDSFKPVPTVTDNRWRKMLILEYYKSKYALKKPTKAEREADEILLKEVSMMNRGHMLMKEISLLNFTAFDYFEYYKDKMTDDSKRRFGYEAIRPGKVADCKPGEIVVVGGFVESVDWKVTKKDKKEMCIIKLSNAGESVNVTVFSSALAQDDKSEQKLIRNLQEYMPVTIKGKVNVYNDVAGVILDDLNILL